MGRIIEIDGYKAFHGEMLIAPRNGKAYIIQSDWLYKPEYDCWYDGNGSYPSRICQILEVM